jgi:hypothetical protein
MMCWEEIGEKWFDLTKKIFISFCVLEILFINHELKFDSFWITSCCQETFD